MKYIFASFILIIAILACVAPVHAEMYKWTDKNGIVHYSSEPGDKAAHVVEEKDLPPIAETGSSSSDIVPDKTLFPGELTVTIRLHFDGKPLSEFTSAPALLKLYSHQLRKWFTPDYSYNAESGTFQVKNIAEEKYSGQVSVYTKKETYGEYPGDYKGKVPIFNPVPNSPTMVTADMERIIHLTGPQDNSSPLNEWGDPCSNKAEFETPVVISWEPLGKDVSYVYSIVRTVCVPFAFKETVVADNISASKAVLDLPPSKNGEFYTLKLEARKNGRIVGSIIVHGHNGFGWDYRFRVIPKRGPVRVISPIKN